MTDTPLGTVRAYIDAFNANDPDAMSAAFAPDGAILDGMAPHLWVGPTAATDWHRDVVAEGAHLGAANYRVTLGDPLHDETSGDSAYVVAPATMTFDLNGVPVTQTGAVFTVGAAPTSGRLASRGMAWAKGQRIP